MEQLSGVIHTMGDKTLPPDSFGYWFSGLCDGEASFSVLAESGKTRNRLGKEYDRRGVDTRLVISLRDDDRPVLEHIRNVMGLGVVLNRVIHKTHGTDGYVNRPVAFWKVSDLDGCLYLQRLFETFPLRSKKSRELPLWYRALELKLQANERRRTLGTRSSKPYTDEMWAEIQSIDQGLKEMRKYGSA